MSTVKVIWPWARRKPHRKTSISEIIKACLQMVAYLQSETLVLHYAPFKNERGVLNPKISQPKILSFKTKWPRCETGSFWKVFMVVLQEMCTSALNSSILIKDKHQEKHQYFIMQLAFYCMLVLPKNVPHGCVTCPNDTLRSQKTASKKQTSYEYQIPTVGTKVRRNHQNHLWCLAHTIQRFFPWLYCGVNK